MLSIVKGLLNILGLLRGQKDAFLALFQHLVEFLKQVYQALKNKDVNSFLYYLISKEEARLHKLRQLNAQKQKRRVRNLSKSIKAYKRLKKKPKKIAKKPKVKSKKLAKIKQKIAKVFKKAKPKKIKYAGKNKSAAAFKSKKAKTKKYAIKSAVKNQMKKKEYIKSANKSKH